jgi:hypothetical protein
MIPQQNKCCALGALEWIELYRGNILECARIATWLAIELAGQHLQLKMDHPVGSSEWALYCQVLTSIPGGKEDPKRKQIPLLVKEFLKEDS